MTFRVDSIKIYTVDGWHFLRGRLQLLLLLAYNGLSIAIILLVLHYKGWLSFVKVHHHIFVGIILINLQRFCHHVVTVFLLQSFLLTESSKVAHHRTRLRFALLLFFAFVNSGWCRWDSDQMLLNLLWLLYWRLNLELISFYHFLFTSLSFLGLFLVISVMLGVL